MEKILEQVKQDQVKFIQLHFSDLLGVVKNLTIPVRQLPQALKDGIWFDGSSVEGFTRIHESDMFLKPDVSTYAVIPWRQSPDGNSARFICDVYTPDGEPFEGDPRYILKRTLAEAQELGLEYNTGPELEFFLFKRDNGLKVLPNDRAGYFDLTTDEAYDVRRDMTVAAEKFGIRIEALHHENAIGQHEIDFRYDNALKTADHTITLRFVLKAIAQQHGLHATFMPKPMAGISGSGMHVHQSLFNIQTGQNAFYDANDPYKLSEIAYQFIAGQLQHVQGMAAVLSPTVNSYKRLVPGFEAPVYISWARTNRSALIRIPRSSQGNPRAVRAELRCPDPSCNVYLVFAVMLKAGLEGIKRKMLPPQPVEEDVYHFSNEKLREQQIACLPTSLWEAIEELKADPLVRETLGEHTYQRYIEAKTAEWNDYRLQVTEWELKKYLEIY